jgi:hypothetical protein
MKQFTITTILSFIISMSFSQDNKLSKNFKFSKVNSVEFNIAGHGIYYSFGYERLLINRRKYKLSAKIDLAYYPASLNIAQAVWIPTTINQIVSFGKHHAELGAGILISRDNIYKKHRDNYMEKQWEKYGIFSFGYRHQKNNSRILYKILFTPVIEYSTGYSEIYPLFGGTIGYLF